MRSVKPASLDAGAFLVGLVIGLVTGAVLGACVGYGLRRPAPVRCTSTVSIEAVGPGEWTLSCGGAR